MTRELQEGFGGKVLKIIEQTNGYCTNCGEPTYVGKLIVTGWPHEIWICRKCVLELAEYLREPEDKPAKGGSKS